MTEVDGFDLIAPQAYGAHLARQSQRPLLREPIRRIDALERAGDPVQIVSSFVVGLKQLPIRYRPGQATVS